MTQQIATTPEQSRRLISCGVDPKTADMCWKQMFNPKRMSLIAHKPFWDDVTPAYSLSRLLELLPTSLTSELGGRYMLELSKLRMHDAWEIQWYSGQRRWTTRDKDGKFCKLWDKSPIEACVKAIEWLTKEGYKLNQIEE